MQHSIIRKWRIRHLINSFDVFIIKGFTVLSSIIFRRICKKLIFHEYFDFFKDNISLTTCFHDWHLIFELPGKYENVVFIFKNPRNRKKCYQKFMDVLENKYFKTTFNEHYSIIFKVKLRWVHIACSVH